jgi:hypothetical protein
VPPRLIDQAAIGRVQADLAFWLKRWARYPLAYVIECVGDTPSHQQAQILNALAEHPFVAVRSGHGIGKTRLMGWVANWYMDCKLDPARALHRVPITAGSRDQLEDAIWPEVVGVCNRKWPFLRSRYTILSDRMSCRESPDAWFATLRTARRETPDALQGFHECFFLIDEGSAVPDEVFQVARGAMGDPGSMGLMTGNPVRLDGYFYEVFHNSKSAWHCLHFASDESLYENEYSYPYVDPFGELHQIKVHGRQTRRWVDEMREEFGENSSTYRVRVKGDFARVDADMIIDPVALSAAWSVPEFPDRDGHPVLMGVDVARMGADDTAVVIRQGRNILHCQSWHGHDLVESRRRIEVLQGEWKAKHILVDTIGNGSGLYDELRHRGYPVISIDVTQAALEDGDARCHRLRDSLWWRARQYFRRGVHFCGSSQAPEWSGLAKELGAPTYDARSGVVKVESKDDLKKRHVPSPNRADALIHTLLYDFQIHVHAKRPKDRKAAGKRRDIRRSWKTL